MAHARGTVLCLYFLTLQTLLAIITCSADTMNENIAAWLKQEC